MTTYTVNHSSIDERNCPKLWSIDIYMSIEHKQLGNYKLERLHDTFMETIVKMTTILESE